MSLPPDMNVKIVEDVDFEMGMVRFNKYELDDGTIIRLIVLPGKIYKTDQKNSRGELTYLMQHSVNVSAVVPSKERKMDKASTDPLDINTENTEQIEFRVLSEPWNIYKLADGTNLRFRAILTSVFKTTKYYNQFGEPSYNVFTDVSADFRVPNFAKRKQRKKGPK